MKINAPTPLCFSAVRQYHGGNRDGGVVYTLSTDPRTKLLATAEHALLAGEAQNIVRYASAEWPADEKGTSTLPPERLNRLQIIEQTLLYEAGLY